MKTKELLSQHGVSFDALDIDVTPGGWQELARFRVPMLPAVIVGDRCVNGWNPRGLAELFGWPAEEEKRLTAAELLKRLELFLEIARDELPRIPDEHLDMPVPDRVHDLRWLCHHIFRVARAFVDAADQGQQPVEWMDGRDRFEFTSTAQIAAYGDEVRRMVKAWPERVQPDVWDRMVETYYGPSRVDELLERTVFHCAQHLRQLQALMAEPLGVEPRRPLRAEELQGILVPEALW